MMIFKIIHFIKIVCLLSSLLFISSAPAFADKEIEVKATRSFTLADYEPMNIHGWTVYIEKAAQSHDRYDDCIKLLNKNLAEIKALFRPDILPQLKRVPIWVNNYAEHGACYHPSSSWLKQNKRMLEKEHSIEIHSVDSYLNWSNTQPYIILHELAHAYHHQVLKYNNPKIIKAFKKAVASKSYESVKGINGNLKRHYALTNAQEYFSECTEAYFGRNDFYPFTRSELLKHDPTGYAMVENAWKIKEPK